jgi:hypothetical protein
LFGFYGFLLSTRKFEKRRFATFWLDENKNFVVCQWDSRFGVGETQKDAKKARQETRQEAGRKPKIENGSPR